MLIAMLIVVVSGPRHGTNGPPGCVLLVAAITFMTRHRAENRAVYFLHKIGSGRAEAFYETSAVKALGIGKLKEVKIQRRTCCSLWTASHSILDFANFVSVGFVPR
jgi:hypothetical protein